MSVFDVSGKKDQNDYGKMKRGVEIVDGEEYDCSILETVVVDPTDRGFSRMRFTDRYSNKCSLQQSSLATEAAIWFGIDIDFNGNKIYSRMHLTQHMVKQLLPVLQGWVETGELTVPSEEEQAKVTEGLRDEEE